MDNSVYEARIGADRMAAGLICIPDPIKGDLDEVLRLRRTLEYIANDVMCFSLEKATDIARLTLLGGVVDTAEQCPICAKGKLAFYKEPDELQYKGKTFFVDVEYAGIF